MPRIGKKLVPISVRLSEEVRDALEKLAKEQDRSLSYLINLACEKYVEGAGKQKK